MDATKLRALDTAEIHLKDAAGEYLYEGQEKVTVVFYGPGSQAASEVETRQTNRALKRMQENDGKLTAASPEQSKQESLEDLITITAGFNNFSYDDKLGRELASAIYSDPDLGFINLQVNKAKNDWGNFKPRSQAA